MDCQVDNFCYLIFFVLCTLPYLTRIVASHIPGQNMKRPSASGKDLGKSASKSKDTPVKRPAAAMASSEGASTKSTKDTPRKESKVEKMKKPVASPKSTPKSPMKAKAEESEKPELGEEGEEEHPASEDPEVEVEEPKRKVKAAERFKRGDGTLKSFVNEEKKKNGWVVRTYKRSETSKFPGQLYYTYQEPGGGHTFYSKKNAKYNGFKE